MPFASVEFGAGFWLITWPWGALLSTYDGFHLNPAALSLAVASWMLRPTTPGTVPCAGPLMTFTRTVDPTGTDFPAGGSVAVTRPAVLPGTLNFCGFSPSFTSVCSAAVHCWPLTSGTLTFFGPVETVSVTVPPLSIFLPAAGSCLKTTPEGKFGLELEALFTAGTRPAARICCSARACFSPT